MARKKPQPFYGQQAQRCRKHKRYYYYACPECYDRNFGVPVHLRVKVKGET